MAKRWRGALEVEGWMEVGVGGLEVQVLGMKCGILAFGVTVVCRI